MAISTTAEIIKSTLPDVEIPNTNIPDFFFKHIRQHVEFVDESNPRPVLISGTSADEFLTVEQMEAMSKKFATGLYHSVGVRGGDVVAVILPNSIYYAPVVLGILMLGASCTLANPANTARELVYQLKDSGAAWIVTTLAIKDVVGDAATELASLIRKIMFIEKEGVPENESSVFDIMCTDVSTHCPEDTEQQPTADSVAFIPYSSGTTGHPKGVLLTHRNIIANILQVLGLQTYVDPGTSGDSSAPSCINGTTVAVLPMYHIYGLLFHCFQGACRGVTTVVMAKFDMLKFLALIEQYKATEALLAPPIVNGLAKMRTTTQKYDLSSMRSVLVGAAPLSKDTIATLEEQMPGLKVFQGYGLTETSPAVSLNRYEDRVIESSGRLLPNIEAKVVDDDGNTLDVGARGELCFRGPNIMIGYLNRKEDTERAIDQDGFFHTGDIGYVDAQQHVYLTDRKKELIKYNGFQVAPAELEGIILQHPSVHDCAVVGIYDEARQTEVPRAFLVLSHEKAADEKIDMAETEIANQVVEWTNGQVAYYKHLRGGYVILESIPKSAAGKILRRVLKARHSGAV
ncbi:hypothetical protein IW140_004246 [Coemansia sp. RSA 1813]|nr:hypothetical protein EV178_004586 [Coemansia sp. RSA 1646]KAJ1770486.1 hypothetical protein LPJ74_003158 [Coemansia sp. RSA 1843]KAJ2088157.1 hypothetical protein IW138_004419 [Coemansia sp. RSA 986]KAJ2212186.1 hypothetical protein EV179_004875 [Coemansia sp. RSA 487]KAJ2568001.1 hypothetical protein IW140_004246 [Coemansia sp. RSA 1813]